MTEQVPASVRYKELTALATTAAQKLRKHEKARAAGLSDEVAAGQQRKDAAAKELETFAAEVKTRWRIAVRLVWHEKWLKGPDMDAFPEPDHSAPRVTPEKSINRIQAAHLELREAVQKLHFGLLRRKKPPKDFPPPPDHTADSPAEPPA
ncbi:hypothetical protein LZ318_02420 [Saccharopolyspora indica]|uniref:hypothetical protein n=1 Tax=Saccharopolyspora indica TaxID=1229659 RepID=UPI0022EA6F11|nr:hypothetical protein [Saccharopolyspora indica]MDA3648196.1 hypothetical protein [Saccharopolyspora indica]